MKKVLFSLITVALILTACGGSVSPTMLNETIVKTGQDVVNIKNTFDKDLTSAIKSKNYESITAITDSALTKMDAKIDRLKAMQAPEGGQAYKEIALKTFEEIRANVEIGKKYADLKPGATKEFRELEKEYNAKEKECAKLFKEIGKVQSEYAKSVGRKVK